MGSMNISKTDKVCRALENMGYVLYSDYKPYSSKFTVYRKDGEDDYLFVGHRANVRRGKTVTNSTAVLPGIVNGWIIKHYKQGNQ